MTNRKRALVVLLLAIGCGKKSGDSSAVAKKIEDDFRAKGAAINVEVRGTALVIKNLTLDGKPFCAAGFESFLNGPPAGLDESDALFPRVDFARAHAAGVKRIECEDGRGGVHGVDLPLKTR